MTQIADELRKVREALATCKYKKTTWKNGSSEQYSFDFSKIKKAWDILGDLIPQVEFLERKELHPPFVVDENGDVHPLKDMEGATTRKDEASSDATVTPSANNLQDALWRLSTCLSLISDSYIELAKQYTPGLYLAITDLVAIYAGENAPIPTPGDLDWLDEQKQQELVARGIARGMCTGPKGHLDEQEELQWRNYTTEAFYAIATIKRLAAERAPQSDKPLHHITSNGCSVCGADAVNCKAWKALDRLIAEIELMETVPLDKDLEPGSCESKGGHGSPVISVLKWDGDLLATPPICHPHQVEIYENVTGILLGLIGSINPTLLRHDVFRVPLRATQHWGVTFAGEDAFDSGICQYVAFRVEDFYFNGGRSKKRCLWIDYSEWQKLFGIVHFKA